MPYGTSTPFRSQRPDPLPLSAPTGGPATPCRNHSFAEEKCQCHLLSFRKMSDLCFSWILIMRSPAPIRVDSAGALCPAAPYTPYGPAHPSGPKGPAKSTPLPLAARGALECNGMKRDPIRCGPWPRPTVTGRSMRQISDPLPREGAPCAVGGARSNIQSPSQRNRSM